MHEPFFTILIPTKNRSEIVGGAIQSVLDQTFGDFEIVVSDNDDSPDATRLAAASFTDPRVRYFRTSGKLAMHENWENALQQARGQHVLLVEDKQRLVTNALAILEGILRRQPLAVISYPVLLPDSVNVPPAKEPPSIIHFPSEDLVRRFCEFDPDIHPLLPRALNSTAPRSLLSQLRQSSPTGLVFSHLAPDYSCAFQVLRQAPEILHVTAGLIYVPVDLPKRGNYSNGFSCLKKDEQARRFFASLPVSTDQIASVAPVKTHWLALNVVLWDFQQFMTRPGWTPPWNWVRYHGYCLYYIALGKLWGFDMSPEWVAVQASLRKEGLWFALCSLLDFVGRVCMGLWGRIRGNRHV